MYNKYLLLLITIIFYCFIYVAVRSVLYFFGIDGIDAVALSIITVIICFAWVYEQERVKDENKDELD